MLHLQKLLFLVRRSASPVHSSLHRALLSTAASPVHFTAEDYLVDTCGLTKEQAAKATRDIAPCKAKAVLSFLASPALGLSKADVAHIVAHDARILNRSVDNTLQPRVDAILSHGFTAAQIRTFLLWPVIFRCFNTDKKLGFWVPFLGSQEKFLRILKRNCYLLTSDLDRVVKVNIQLLRESGLSDGDVAKVCMASPRLLTSKPDRVRAVLTSSQELGFPHDSLMFRHVVAIVSRLGPGTMAAKLKFIGEMLGCSDAEVAKAVKACPGVLNCSMEKLRRVSEFLTKVVGVDSKYILANPLVLMFSLERRIAPRHYVRKVLLEKGLMRKEQSVCSLLAATDKTFQSRYIIRHQDVLPGLANAYASACKGNLPQLEEGFSSSYAPVEV